jgi:hypothetical protein
MKVKKLDELGGLVLARDGPGGLRVAPAIMAPDDSEPSEPRQRKQEIEIIVPHSEVHSAHQ